MTEFVETDECPAPACRWRGSWDGAVCPECGADTKPITCQACKPCSSGKHLMCAVIGCECTAPICQSASRARAEGKPTYPPCGVPAHVAHDGFCHEEH